MKKIFFIVVAIIMMIIILKLNGPLIALGLGACLAYYSFRSYTRAESVLSKIDWVIVGLIGLSVTFYSIPALIGLLAIVALYYGYKQWKKERKIPTTS